VGMLAIGDQDPAEALHVRSIVGAEVLELVHPLQIPDDRTPRAVDLDPIVVLAAGGRAGRLEAADRALIELGEEGEGVVDVDVAAPAVAVTTRLREGPLDGA